MNASRACALLARSGGLLLVEPPKRIPLLLRPGLWLARRITGKDPLPGRLLAHAPKTAVGFGVFELLSAHAPRDLDARTLATARIAASAKAGCPFCIDMNAATWRSAGLTEHELAILLDETAALHGDERFVLAARYARALSDTPVVVPADLGAALQSAFSARELVVLAATIAQVNAWARFNHGLGVPAAGFFDDSTCAVRLPSAPHAAPCDGASCSST